MYRNLLVPIDGSTLSEYSVPFAIEIARRARGRVHLLRALPESILTDIPVSLQASSRKLAQTHLEKLAAAYSTPDVPVTTDLRVGFPVEEILRASPKFDLVVMTTQGAGAISRWVLGSVTDKVIRMAPKPVLAIHPRPKATRAQAEATALRMFRDVCVPLDGSALSEKAIKELGQFEDGEATVHLVRVVARDAGTDALEMARDSLLDAASPVQARGVRVKSIVKQADNVAGAIADAAQKAGCGVIVMVTHGEGGPSRWLLGGVTDKVVRVGPLPVLVIRAGRPLWKDGKRPLTARR
ncbi:MAG: universal stress protein [Candidatus Brocadiae bacterium]|nr:universal stress protein [Candidatus Brocadiia bacterium]